MAFSNDTKHNFSGGELSPKLRGRSDLEAYFSSADRLENFIPTPEGPAEFRPGTTFLDYTDTPGVGGSIVRDLIVDEDIVFTVLNVSTGDISQGVSARLESIKVYFYRYEDVIKIKIQSTIYGNGNLELVLSTGQGVAAPLLKDIRVIQIEEKLLIFHPACFTFNILYWDTGYNFEFQSRPAGWYCYKYPGVYSFEYPFWGTYPTAIDSVAPLVGFPFYNQTAGPKPTGVALFQQRLIILSSSSGVVHFGQAPSTTTGRARYYNFAGQKTVQKGTGGSNYRAIDSWGSEYSNYDAWHVTSADDFKVYVAGLEFLPLPDSNPAGGAGTHRFIFHKNIDGWYISLEIFTTHWVTDTTYSEIIFERNVGYADDGFTVELNTILPGEELFWLLPLKDFIIVGSNSGVYSISSSDGAGVSATNIKVSVLSYTGAARTRPIPYKDGLIYVDTTNRNFQYIRYDFLNSGYKAVTLTTAQQRLITQDINTVVFSPGYPDTLFLVDKYYGVFGITMVEDSIRGIYRMTSAPMFGISSMFSFFDTRVQKNTTLIAYQSTAGIYTCALNASTPMLDAEQYYTGAKEPDRNNYIAYLQEILAAEVFLDIHQTVYYASEVILSQEFEGLDMDVIADGQYLGVYRVPATPWTISLDKFYNTIHIGFRYAGMIKSVAITGGGVNGEAGAKNKNLSELAIYFSNTLGAKYGFDIYETQEVLFAESANLLAEQPPLLFTGVKRLLVPDTWDINKHLYIVQDQPFPCTILRMDIFGETSSE